MSKSKPLKKTYEPKKGGSRVVEPDKKKSGKKTGDSKDAS